jgi:hypothetical protein
MPTKAEYEAAIQAMDWPGLATLWDQIKARDTPWWPPGKAFEYLVIRMFQLGGADVRWPYSVNLFGGDEIEQIDGSLKIESLYCLVETKDEDGNIAIGPIAKLRSQLLRRPGGTVGFIFSSHAFTDPAVQLAHFAMPQAVLLWSGDEVEKAFEINNICGFALVKYRMCVNEGMPDFSIAVP